MLYIDKNTGIILAPNSHGNGIIEKIEFKNGIVIYMSDEDGYIMDSLYDVARGIFSPNPITYFRDILGLEYNYKDIIKKEPLTKNVFNLSQIPHKFISKNETFNAEYFVKSDDLNSSDIITRYSNENSV